MKILIVDDDADVRQVIKYTVENEGHQVLEAADGAEGLVMARRHRPDVVISDALMPRMDGYEFLRAVKSDVDLKSTPFVLHTAIYTGAEDLMLALSLGAEGLIEKPFRPDMFWKEFSLLMEKAKEKRKEADGLELPTGENEYLRDYSKIVAANLEKKVHELERVIAERRRLEDQLFAAKQDWENTFNTITDMVTVHDKDSNIIRANKAAVKVLGLPSLETNKVKCFEYFHGTGCSPEGCPSCTCLKTGVPGVFEMFEPYLNMFIEIRAIPRFDSSGRIEGLIHVVRDITERKELELQIKEHASRLETQVRERTRQLEEANNELQTVNKELELRRVEAVAANRAKSGFLANMSHELRTPLNAIIGFSEIMINGMTGPLTEEQLDFVRDIDTSGKHLLTLINDILDLSKVEAGKMEPDLGPLNVQGLVEKSIMMFKEKAMKHGINVEYQVDGDVPVVTADEMKLKQVLVNLLSNAFKFSPDGGSVRVSARRVRSMEFGVGSGEESSEKGVWSREKESIYSELRTLNSALDRDFIEISVEDAGPGIRAEDIPRLFQPFQQLETTLTRKTPGTGLGLNLCKKFVEMHSGRIWVESEAGKGSRFIFTIPLITHV